MMKVGIPTLFLLSIFFVTQLPITLSQLIRPQPPPVPLCASQFALANYACVKVPLVQLPPPAPLPPPPPDSPPPPEAEGHRHHHRHGHGNSQGQENGHGHRHRHRHRHHETPDERNCCRWLQQIDNECVCDVLVHLPPFLSRPNHDYTVVVDETCSVTYKCGGRLIGT
ncbi:tetratricopeptide repeat-containing protein-like protein [Corchorus olitorius]|uniref:Tetratricopeptide repeat-containing protein-like protein n=1 Tax=Corchorus olitorius TaxID=93759 RepID=A0A1R3KD53_9ROSI|nr:tetratricopeptide repeat-containing protein-like protein [Corchorus olitorius]